MPKLAYKGATVQYQRVKAKKAPKIEEVELTEEQRREAEQRAFEEQKQKDALSEKQPAWKLYINLEDKNEIMRQDFWEKMVDNQFEEMAGDE